MNFLKTNTGKLIVGGSALSIALGYGIYHYVYLDGSEEKAGVKILPKDIVIKILKDMQKEFFSTFSSLAMIGIQIQQQSRNKIPQNELEYILSNQPHFTQEITDVENRIYLSNNVTEKDFKYACQETFKNEPEVQQLQKDMRNQMSNATKGVLPDSKTDIPEFLTPEKTLKIYERIMKTSALKIREVFQNLKQEGEEINLNNPRVLNSLNNVKLEEIKKLILQEEGLNNFDDAPSKILQYASIKFTRENSSGFAEKMKKLEFKHQASVEQVFKNPDIPEEIINNAFLESPSAAFKNNNANPDMRELNLEAQGN